MELVYRRQLVAETLLDMNASFSLEEDSDTLELLLHQQMKTVLILGIFQVEIYGIVLM